MPLKSMQIILYWYEAHYQCEEIVRYFLVFVFNRWFNNRVSTYKCNAIATVNIKSMDYPESF